jgi:beta-lactamase regulating signal transducer with metallopeptidase domain/uncharacterized GH25 family protein
MSSLAWIPAPAILAFALRLSACVTMLLMAAGVLTVLIGRRAPAVRHAIGLFTLLAALSSPLAIVGTDVLGLRWATVPWREWTAWEKPDAPTTATSPAPDAHAKLSPGGMFRPIPDLPRPAPSAETAPLHVELPVDSPPPEPRDRTGRDLEQALASIPDADPAETEWPTVVTQISVALWSAGVLGFLLRFLRGLWLLRVLRRSTRPVDDEIPAGIRDQVSSSLGIDRLPPIAVSSRVAGPVAMGLIRPLVILPERLIESLEPTALRDVLVHECAHVRRRDHLVGLLQRLAEMLYWPHPLIHVLNRRLSRAREEICDNFVLAQGDACEFARTLLFLAERGEGACRPLRALPLMTARWKLEDRVAGLLNPRRSTMTGMSRKSVTALAIILFGTSAALAGIGIGELEPPLATIPLESGPQPADAPAEGPWREIRGRVTDASGEKPIEAATVNLIRSWKSAGPVKTGRDGGFTLKTQGPMLLEERLIASTEDSRLQGTAAFREPSDSQAAPGPTIIRLEPGRIVEVTVRNGRGTPVADASVEVAALEYGGVVEGKTGPDGRASLRYPAGIKVQQIVAFKPGAGLDYYENYRSLSPHVETPLPESVSLVLNGSRSVRVKAVDTRGNAIPGLLSYTGAIQKRGKLAYASPTVRSAMPRTEADGVARFDWIPADLNEGMWFGVLSDKFHSVRAAVNPGQRDVEIVMRLTRKVMLRGQVLKPDDTPASGILVEAGGVGREFSDEYDRGYARTGGDGMFAIPVAPGHSYMVGVQDQAWAARSLTNVVLRREGGDYELPKLRLVKGTLIEGRPTRGPDKKPAANEWVSLSELGEPLPRDYRPFTQESREWLSRGVKTDAAGRYTFRVGPGEYRLRLPDGQVRELTVDQEEKLVQEDHLDRAVERHRLSGVVRDRTAGGNAPVADARVRVEALGGREHYQARTDAQGRFELDVEKQPLSLYARNAGGTRAGFAMMTAGETVVEVNLGEAGSVTGRVVDERGSPCGGRRVSLMIGPGSVRMSLNGFTDALGRFRFDGLVVGSTCVLLVDSDEDSDGVGAVVTQEFGVAGGATTLPDVVVSPKLVPESLRPSKLDGVVSPIQTSRPLPPTSPDGRPATVPSGPSRSEISELIRAIGRDPSSAELIDRIAARYHPRWLWSLDFARMLRLVTDPTFSGRMDALAKEVQGKPLDTFTLIRCAMLGHHCYDDAMMRQFLREWFAEERLPRSTIRGVVVDAEAKQPIPFPRVYSDDAIATADEHGKFSISMRQAAGKTMPFTLWIEADGHASGQWMAKDPGEQRIALRPDAACFGRVVDAQGQPVAGAVVRAHVPRDLLLLGDMSPDESRGGSHGIFEVKTDRTGRFSFQGVPASDLKGLLKMLKLLKRDREIDDPRWPFLIKVSDVQGNTLIDAKFKKRSNNRDGGTPFTAVIQAKRAELQVDSIRGVVRVVLDQAELQNYGDKDDVMLINRNILELPVPAEGQFLARGQPIHLEVSHPRYQRLNTETSSPTHSEAAPSIRLEPGSMVSGLVVDGSGKPIADAMVQVRDPNRLNHASTAFTGPDGRFAIHDARPGRWTVVVQAEGRAAAWAPIVADVSRPVENQFVLEPGEFLSGKVLGPDGKPVPGAAVGWANPIRADGRPDESLELKDMTATDAEGLFRLGPLPPGQFQITAVKEGPRRMGRTTARSGQSGVAVTIRPGG